MRRREGGKLTAKGKNVMATKQQVASAAAAGSIVRPQVTRLKTIEDSIEGVLRNITSDYRVGEDRSSAAGMDGRISNIERLMGELKEVIDKKQKEESTQRHEIREKEQKEENVKRQDESAASLSSKRSKVRYSRVDITSNNHAVPLARYYIFKFTEESRRSVNPYSVIDKVKEVTGVNPKRVFGNNRTSLTAELCREMSEEQVKSITSVDGIPCEVSMHSRYNCIKGLIYVYEYDIENVEEFKSGLQSNYNISDVQPAPFIKTKSDQTHAFIVTFNQEHLPYSIYIPGERSDTRVYKFKSKPLMCNKCMRYGHAKKWCKQENPVCKRCSESGHAMEQCQSETPKCFHCQGNHAAGSKDCPKHQREEQLIEIQEKEKVTIMRARQILENNCEYTQRPTQQYPTHFDCIMDESNKRKFTPWLLEKCIEKHIGSKPKSIRTVNKTTFIIEVCNKEQGSAVQTITNINGIDAEIKINNFAHLNKGLIYVYGYNMVDFDGFKSKLMEQHNLQDVKEASWIKTRSNNRATPLLVTFHNELPHHIEIPGEMMNTKVIEYKQRPLMCRKCLAYGHGKNSCEKEQRCKKCSESGHDRAECAAQQAKCVHCGGNHETGSETCVEHRYQEEILAVQTKERVSRMQAKSIFDRNNPHFKTMSYAGAIKVGRESEGNTEASSNTAPQQQQHQRQEQQQHAGEEVAIEDEVEIVCMSPSSGQLFTQTINIAGAAQRSGDLGDRTSEDSAIVRSEVRAIYDQQTKEMSHREEQEENRDIEQYEMELEQAGRPEREAEEAGGRRRERDERERRRSKSRKRRSRSNSNDRRRRSKQRKT